MCVPLSGRTSLVMVSLFLHSSKRSSNFLPSHVYSLFVDIFRGGYFPRWSTWNSGLDSLLMLECNDVFLSFGFTRRNCHFKFWMYLFVSQEVMWKWHQCWENLNSRKVKMVSEIILISLYLAKLEIRFVTIIIS